MTVYVDPTFRLPVRTHLLANLMTLNPVCPLVLGIFGPSGEGKTFQVERICTELGLVQHLLSPGELESENAGAPGQLLRRQYLQAGAQSKEGHPGVLIVHDIDTILGNWGSLVQYTVNRQVVYAQLMAFCDFPDNVAGQACSRVPIVLTGNNPSILYGPLLRPGRTRLLRWRPDIRMRTRMVAPLFPGVAESVLERILIKYQEMPTSFWSDVRSLIAERQLDAVISSIGEAEINRILSEGLRLRIEDPVFTDAIINDAAAELKLMDVRDESYLSESSGAGI